MRQLVFTTGIARKLLAFIAITFILQGCITLHPPYQRPCLNLPEAWRLETDEGTTTANMRWWEQFNDPVLDNLIIQSLEYNNDLKIAIGRVWEFYARLGIVSADLYPLITANGSYTRSELSLNTGQILPGNMRTFNLYTALLNVSWELDIWGQIRSATEAAFNEYLAQIEARRTVVLTVVSSVASTYFLLRQYDKQLDVSKKTLKSRIDAYELAKHRFEGGVTSELPVTQAAADVEEAKVQVIEFEINVQQTENALCVLVGRNPQAIERGLTLDELTMPPVVPAGLPADLLCQRPDILEAEYALKAANARIGEALALYFPQVNLTGDYGNESIFLHNLFTNPSLTWQYTISLAQTLFDAGKISSQVDQTEAIHYEAYYSYVSRILNAFKEVNDALIAHKKILELVVVEKQRVDVLAKSLMLANLQYENGETDYLNVLDAERNLFQAQLNFVQAQSDSFISLVSLYKALGGGWVIEADCDAITSLTDRLEPCPLVEVISNIL